MKNKIENYSEISNKSDGTLKDIFLNKKTIFKDLNKPKPKNFKNYEEKQNKVENNNITNSLEFESNLKQNNVGNNIELEFIFNNDLSKSYKLEVKKTDLFKDVIALLKKKYPELKEKTMKVFQFDSKIINNKNTIQQNEIEDKEKIIIIP